MGKHFARMACPVCGKNCAVVEKSAYSGLPRLFPHYPLNDRKAREKCVGTAVWIWSRDEQQKLKWHGIHGYRATPAERQRDLRNMLFAALALYIWADPDPVPDEFKGWSVGQEDENPLPDTLG